MSQAPSTPHPFTTRLLETLSLYTSPPHSQYILSLSFSLLQQSLTPTGFSWPHGFGFVAYAIMLSIYDEEESRDAMQGMIQDFYTQDFLKPYSAQNVMEATNSGERDAPVEPSVPESTEVPLLTFAQKRAKVQDCVVVLSECYEMGYKTLPEWLHFSVTHMKKDIIFQIHDLWKVVVDRYEEERRIIERALVNEPRKVQRRESSRERRRDESDESEGLDQNHIPLTENAGLVKAATLNHYIGFVTTVDSAQGLLAVEISESGRHAMFVDLSSEPDVKHAIREGDLIECQVDWEFQKAFNLRRIGNLEKDISERDDTAILHQLENGDDELDDHERRELHTNRLRCLFGDWVLRYHMDSSRGTAQQERQTSQDVVTDGATTNPTTTLNLVTTDKLPSKSKRRHSDVNSQLLSPQDASAVHSARSVSVSELDAGEEESNVLPQFEFPSHSALSPAPSQVRAVQQEKQSKSPFKSSPQKSSNPPAATVRQSPLDDDLLDETNSWNTDSTKDIFQTDNNQAPSAAATEIMSISPQQTGKPPLSRSLQNSSPHDSPSFSDSRKRRSMPDMLDTLNDLSPRKPKRREITTPTERILQSSVQNIRELLSNLDSTSSRPTEDIVTESVHNIEKILQGFKSRFKGDDEHEMRNLVREKSDTVPAEDSNTANRKLRKRKSPKLTSDVENKTQGKPSHAARPQPTAIRRKKLATPGPQPKSNPNPKARDSVPLFTPYREPPVGAGGVALQQKPTRKSPKLRRLSVLPDIHSKSSKQNAKSSTPNAQKKNAQASPQKQRNTAQKQTMSRYLTNDKDEIIHHLETQVLQLRSVVEEQAEAMMGLREDLERYQRFMEEMRRARSFMDFDMFDSVMRQNLDGMYAEMDVHLMR